MANVSGTWLGTYWQDGNPTRFEATLVQSSNALSGNVLDDGHLGEALVHGEVVGRTIDFTKRYLSTSPHLIRYTGTIAEDENFMQGQWQIGKKEGYWEAYRSNSDLMADLNSILQNKVPAGIR